MGFDFRGTPVFGGIALPTDIFSMLGLNKTNVQYDMTGERGKNRDFRLETFISEVSGQGLARPNWYYVLIHTPRGGGLEMKASLLCCGAELPSINIMSAPQRIQGYSTEMPYGFDFPDVTMSFYVDSNMQVKSFFDKWARAPLLERDETFEVNYYNDYVADIEIIQIDAETNDIYSVKLKNAWPKTVSGLQLAGEAQNQIHKLSVVFTYDKWIVTKENADAFTQRLSGNPLLARTGLGGLFDGFKSLLAAPLQFVKEASSVISTITNIFTF